MRLTQAELGVVALIIGYIAFFTHPPPSHISDFLSTPVGKIMALVGILYVTAYQSLIIGVFLAIAYLLTAGSVTEYLDPTEQTPKKEEPKQPTSKGVPAPDMKSVLSTLLKAQTGPAFKGDRLSAVAQKKGSPPPPAPKTVAPPKASAPLSKGAVTEHFASF